MPRITKRTTPQALIRRMVQRIVDKFHPEQVILFGSHARGAAGPDSDVDLLIVMDFEGTAFDKGLEIMHVRDHGLTPVYVIASWKPSRRFKSARRRSTINPICVRASSVNWQQ